MDVKDIRIGQGVKGRIMGIVTSIDSIRLVDGYAYSVKIETGKGQVIVRPEHLEPYDEWEK